MINGFAVCEVGIEASKEIKDFGKLVIASFLLKQYGILLRKGFILLRD